MRSAIPEPTFGRAAAREESGGPERPHVVAILPRGEAIRNFVYSGALDLVSSEAQLTVLSVFPSNDIRDLMCSRYPAVQPLREIREYWLVGALRDILDMAHGRWLWSEAAQTRWRVKDGEATSLPLKFKRAAKKAACYPFASRPGLNVLSAMERSTSKWLRATDDLVRMFATLRPSLVFNSSPIHSQLALQTVQAAQWQRIPTATFVFSWDNLTSQGRIVPQYDYYLVWNHSLRNQLLRIYHTIRPDQVFVTGTPQFDFHFKPQYHWSREEFCQRVGADPARPIVLYSTGMPVPQLGEPRIVEGIADMLRDMTTLRPQLLVRVYPKDRTGRFDELRQRRRDILFPEVPWEPRWYTPRPEDSYLLTNMLRHCAVGINIASTISLELCMFGKPTLNVAYNPPGVDVSPYEFADFYRFDHYRPVVESGAVELAHSEAEMAAMLRGALSNPHAAEPRQRAFIRKMFDDMLDGRSANRVAECLLELANRAHQRTYHAAAG